MQLAPPKHEISRKGLKGRQPVKWRPECEEEGELQPSQANYCISTETMLEMPGDSIVTP
jgi:hypothetical protein